MTSLTRWPGRTSPTVASSRSRHGTSAPTAWLTAWCERGVKPGDRVAIAITADQPFEWLTSYMGIHRLGAVAVPLTTRLSGHELELILTHAGAKALLASDSILATHPRLARGIDVIGSIAGTDTSRDAFCDLCSDDADDLDHVLDEDDVADIMYTSGTTGTPKGVVVRHGGLSTSDRVPKTWHGLGFLTSSPFSTTSGSLLICGPMRGGSSGWFLPRFDPARWLEIVSLDRPVAAFLVPAMVLLIVADPHFSRADLSSLVVVNIGSAPIATETLRQFGAALSHADVMCGYGMTEFGAVSATPPGDGGVHLGSVGHALPGVRLRIVDLDGQEVARGATGEITVSGDRARRTYLDDSEASAQTWVDGWLHSGDLGYLDDDGFLWVVGRQKEIIIRGGHNIAPGEVEAALLSHPDVVDAAVAGVAHRVLGEDIAAWIVLGAGAGASVSDVSDYLLTRLADYKVPRRLRVVDSLPRNEAGKVLKAELVNNEAQRSDS